MALTFRLVRYVYVFLGFTDDDVPYTTPGMNAIEFRLITQRHGG